ncbi:unnamed protein product [Vitrella brassicaformis CCMP3155]|uniref:Rubisco LSMT substrate-binding domain-containing protein n=1 Tax=Vitrella brassicaformis (strain CCMP3155) TaxID=1169540 RepID=A0A0G4GY69_VITBC|nr:unnamed protein product [Vitrella brassicaformis CCMP3155]|eukprot:CEM35921.1 unnamed protein product [Vitrella brassicaformis CCMP3155]
MLGIPGDLLMNTRSALKSDIGESIVRPLYVERAELCAVDVLVLHLLRERAKGQQSLYAAYMASLPPTYSTLYYYSDAEAKAIQPAFRRREVARHRQDVRRMYQRLTTLVFSSPSVSRLFLHPSEADVAWAYYTVMTRGCYWPSPLIPERESSSNDRDCWCLVPLGDLFNFAIDDSVCGYERSSGEYVFRAGRDYQPGEELFICYCQKGNWSLIDTYGFAIPLNTNDAIEVTPKAPSLDALDDHSTPARGACQAEYASLLERHGLLQHWFIGWAPCHQQHQQDDEEDDSQQAVEISHNLLTTLRLAVALQSSSHNAHPLIDAVLLGEALPAAADERRVWSMVCRLARRALSSYETTLEHDEALLGDQHMTRRQDMKGTWLASGEGSTVPAVDVTPIQMDQLMVRVGEKRLLHRCIDMCTQTDSVL